MNKRNINLHISRKVNDWLKSITDEHVRKLAADNVIVTGGAICSLLQGETPNDYDVYFKTFEATYEVAKYYINQFNKEHLNVGVGLKVFSRLTTEEQDNMRKVIEQEEEIYQRLAQNKANLTIQETNDMNALKDNLKNAYQRLNVKEISEIMLDTINDKSTLRIYPWIQSQGIAGEIPEEEEVTNESKETADSKGTVDKYVPKFITSNAISLSDDIQVIVRFFGDPKQIHDNFDFVHCTNYWTQDTKAVLNEYALEAIINKELIYVGSKYPVCSVIRTRKFLNRGWHINAGQYLKMSLQISKLDLTNMWVLKEQLVGVDTTYMLGLVNALATSKLGAESIDGSYVMTLISRLFDSQPQVINTNYLEEACNSVYEEVAEEVPERRF